MELQPLVQIQQLTILACANAGISQSACASKQVSTLITSNPNLGAESSDSTTFSISQDMGELTPALNNLSLRLDWFNIEMDRPYIVYINTRRTLL